MKNTSKLMKIAGIAAVILGALGAAAFLIIAIKRSSWTFGVIAGGCVSAGVLLMIMFFGLARIAENNDRIALCLTQAAEAAKKNAEGPREPLTRSGSRSDCPMPGREGMIVYDPIDFVKGVCPSCGKELAFPESTIDGIGDLRCPFCRARLEKKNFKKD